MPLLPFQVLLPPDFRQDIGQDIQWILPLGQITFQFRFISRTQLYH